MLLWQKRFLKGDYWRVSGKVEGVLAEVLQLPPSEITDDLTMKDVEVWDSLKHMELIVALETALEVQLTFEEIVAMQSVREIKRVLAERSVEV